jgi:hypothetical protein
VRDFPFDLRPSSVHEDSPVAAYAKSRGTRKPFSPPRGTAAGEIPPVTSPGLDESGRLPDMGQCLSGRVA